MTDPFDYLESRDDADELIQEFGQSVALQRTTTGGDPDEPTETTTNYPTYAARVEFTLKQIQGGDVQDNDQRWLVAAGPLTGITKIAPPDKIVVGGIAIPVLVAKPLAPAGTVVMFDCQCRF